MKFVIYELITPTCSVCKMIEKVIDNEMKKYPNVELKRLSALEGQGKALADKHNVKKVPMFIIDDELVDGSIPAFKKAMKEKYGA